MAKPSSRQELIDYCLRRLGAPVLEINVDDDQIDDLVDDALQYFNERHFDGVERMYLKYKITQGDVDRGKADPPNAVGIVTTTATSTTGTSFNWYENSNFIQIPDSVIGIEKVFKFDWGAQSPDTYLVIDCYRILNPTEFTNVYNDSFLKQYLTSLIKRQWGQNLIKFRGVKLPGGIELNGREIYDDAEKELDSIKSRMAMDYELPPYDFIG